MFDWYCFYGPRDNAVLAQWGHSAAGARYTRDGQPEGIVCYFAGQTDIDGILFDKCHPGGIIAPPGNRANWKNVFYGKDNLAAPDELHRDLKVEGAN